MHPVYVHLAMDWLKAERRENPDEWRGREFDRSAMSVAIDRVIAVVSGQVAWQDASPGDRAVWKSRVFDVQQFEREWRTSGESTTETLVQEVASEVAEELTRATPTWSLVGSRTRLIGVKERLWWNFYDTVRIGDSTGSSWPPALNGPGTQRLFGNANIGNVFLTNCQIGGQMPGNCTFVVTSLHVSLSSMEVLEWAADNVLFEFNVGERAMLPPLFVRDLFRGITLNDPGRRPIIIPVQQNYSAMMQVRRSKPADVPDFDLTFHIEGLRTRDIQ